jgi:hypothetical protein
MEKMENARNSQKTPLFECEKCLFKCSKKSDWLRHLSTDKHNLAVNDVKLENDGNNKKRQSIMVCDCGKKFETQSGLWKHKKRCNTIFENMKSNIKDDMSVGLLVELFQKQMNENNELRNLLIEQNQKLMEIATNPHTTTINNNNNNTMNNKFNLNFFLNETCKDAMNIQEFIDFCKVQHTDFENFGKYGYVESMTRIIMRNLMELEVHRRPIHCTDAKREVLYVKDNNVWVNDFSREKLIRAIKYIAAKNVKQIPDWMDHNPDSKNTQTKLHDKYMRMVCHSMGGRDEAEDQEYYKKIIHNVAKEVVINKNI